MEYPKNPSPHFRVATLAPALITLLVLATLQPLVVISMNAIPWEFGDAGWRVRSFALFLGTAPQTAVCLVVIAVLGLFAGRYRAVRGASIAALVLGVLLVPVLLLYWLDILQIRQMVSLDVVRRFDLNALQTAAMAGLMVPVLLWMGIRGFQAGRDVPTLDIADVLMVGNEPTYSPGPVDPRVNN